VAGAGVGPPRVRTDAPASPGTQTASRSVRCTVLTARCPHSQIDNVAKMFYNQISDFDEDLERTIGRWDRRNTGKREVRPSMNFAAQVDSPMRVVSNVGGAQFEETGNHQSSDRTRDESCRRMRADPSSDRDDIR